MKKPIFYKNKEDSELFVFESIEHAESYIEPIDLKLSGGVFYDSNGKILQSYITKNSREIEIIVIRDDGKEIFNKSELKRLLIDFLEHYNYSKKELEKMELLSLARESLKFKTE